MVRRLITVVSVVLVFGGLVAVPSLALVPNDPNFVDQWYATLIGMESAWDVSTGDPETVVAILSTGVDESHPDFAGASFVPGKNIIVDGGDTGDSHGVGTELAGLIAAQQDNGLAISGIAPGVSIMPVVIPCTSWCECDP